MMDVTVVVPTYRRPEYLERCLAALVAQEFDPSAYEIIVADDAGSVLTWRQVQAWAQRSHVPVRYAAPGRARGPAAARNAGWRASSGRLIAFTDDDCIPHPRWLAEGVAALRPRIAALAGRVVVPIPERPTDYERDAAGLASAEFVTANCFVRCDVLAAVGGFDERYREAWREDSDLHFTLLERGYAIARAADAVVVHPVRPAQFGASLRQQRKAFFNALLYKKFPAHYQEHIRAAPPWDYYGCVLAVAVAAAALAAGATALAFCAVVLWLILTARFCARRLKCNSTVPRHVLEMAVTSALIPPLSVFWRLYGALRFRVRFM